ncbi:MAG: hypothetical protein FWE01_00560 [Firmicutes bacterium]|nr:hypothetical protein [Bacillota bacterium]
MKRRILTIVGIAIVVFAGGLTAILINAMATTIRLSPVGSIYSVSGNGGNAVSVGGYLYFIGNFHSRYDINRRPNNIYGNPGTGHRLTNGAIWRIRLNEEGLPQYDNSWIDGWQDEWNAGHPDFIGGPNSSEIDDLRQDNEHIETQIDSRFVPGTLELVVPKVAGHEQSSLFIMGNHLIYTSPHNYYGRGHDDLQIDRTDFFRVDLTGANNRLLYTTRSRAHQVTRNDFTVAWVDGQSHLLIREPVGDGLSRITHVNVSTARVQTLTTEAATWAFPEVTTFIRTTSGGTHLKGFGGIMSFVYWTEARPESDPTNGDLVFRHHLGSRNATRNLMADDHNTRFQLVSLSGGRLIWRRGNFNTPHNWSLRITESTDQGVFASGAINAETRQVWEADMVSMSTSDSEFNTIVAPTENAGFVFSFFTLFGPSGNQSIWRWTLSDGQFSETVIPGTQGVEEIVKVASSRLFFMRGGQLHSINFDGTIARPPVTISPDRETRINISIFTPIASDGFRVNNAHDFISYIRTIHSIVDDDMVIDDETGESPIPTGNSITIAVIVDRQNNAHRLWNLENEFVGIPS